MANFNLRVDGGGPTVTRRTTADRSAMESGRNFSGYKPTTNSRITQTAPTGSRTPAPTAPSPAPTPATPTPAPAEPAAEPETYDLSALEQILAGIEAQYGLNREELLAGQGEASDLYRYVVANLRAAQAQAESQVQEQGIRRGILRSGIAQEQQADVARTFASQRQDAAAQRDQRLADIALALQELEIGLGREKTSAATDYATTILDSEEALAQALALV